MPHIEHRLTLLTAALRELWALQQERLEEEKRQIKGNAESPRTNKSGTAAIPRSRPSSVAGK
jgi:hypothetical protein